MFYKTLQCLILVLNFWTSPRQRLELTHLISCTLHNNLDVFFVEEQAPNDPVIRVHRIVNVWLPGCVFITLQPSPEFDKPVIPVSDRLAPHHFFPQSTRAAQFSQPNIAFGNPGVLEIFREGLELLPEFGVYARTTATLLIHHCIFQLSEIFAHVECNQGHRDIDTIIFRHLVISKVVRGTVESLTHCVDR